MAITEQPNRTTATPTKTEPIGSNVCMVFPPYRLLRILTSKADNYYLAQKIISNKVLLSSFKTKTTFRYSYPEGLVPQATEPAGGDAHLGSTSQEQGCCSAFLTANFITAKLTRQYTHAVKCPHQIMLNIPHIHALAKNNAQTSVNLFFMRSPFFLLAAE